MLTKIQIDQLFLFCEKKYVRYYDVQAELVDHLANSIESSMEKNPGLSFETALDEVYKEFGIFGFSQIVRNKEQSVMDRQRRFFYTAVKAQFHWPKVVLMLLLTLIFYTAISQFGLPAVWFSLIIVYLGSLAVVVYTSIQFGLIRRRLNKKLVIAEFLYKSSWLQVPLYLPAFINSFFEESTWIAISSHDIYRLLFTFCVSVFIILILAHYQTFHAIEKSVKEGFPELLDANAVSQ